MINKIYDYVIVGGGISGCSVAYELKKRDTNILLIEKLDDISQGASKAAGAFLSPFIGKPSYLKDLTNKSLRYSVDFYNKNCIDFIDKCGIIRIPKNKLQENKFEACRQYMDFKYCKLNNNKYFFDIGSIVDTYNICKILTRDIKKFLNYEVKTIKFKDDIWILNNEIKTKNLILTTGADIKLLQEKYLVIRPVFGQRIDIKTSTIIKQNYHKACSISRSKNGIVSIGATYCRDILTRNISSSDTKELLNKANDIIKLENIEIIKELTGARASSIDYLPIIGLIVNSNKTLKKFPYLKHGVNILSSELKFYKNLFILNGIGSKGFIFAPYLAHILVNFIIDNKKIDENLTTIRLFRKWVKRQKK